MADNKKENIIVSAMTRRSSFGSTSNINTDTNNDVEKTISPTQISKAKTSRKYILI